MLVDVGSEVLMVIFRIYRVTSHSLCIKELDLGTI